MTDPNSPRTVEIATEALGQTALMILLMNLAVQPMQKLAEARQILKEMEQGDPLLAKILKARIESVLVRMTEETDGPPLPPPTSPAIPQLTAPKTNGRALLGQATPTTPTTTPSQATIPTTGSSNATSTKTPSQGRRGRPVGSKNKPKQEPPSPPPQLPEPPTKEEEVTEP